MIDEELVGKTCPYCQSPLKPHDQVAICSACGMPHHVECWQENGGCTTFGCAGRATGGASAPALICPVCGTQLVARQNGWYCTGCRRYYREDIPEYAGDASRRTRAGSGWGVPPPLARAVEPAPADMFRQWNWGAFGITLIWTAAMNRWGWFVAYLLSGCLFPVQIGLSIYLGVRGNELAWESRDWKSVQEFRDTQKVWNIVGIVFTVIGVGIFAIEILAFLFVGTWEHY